LRSVQERRAVVTPLSVAGRLTGRRLLIPAVALIVVAADQATKTWALHQLPDGGRHIVGPVWFVRTFNRGAAFGLGHGATPVVEAVVVALVAWLLAFSGRASRTANVGVAVGLGLLLGGAAGNLIDRIFRHIPGYPGAVIDFIDAVRIGTHDWWPVFNVADASIVIGVVVLVVCYVRRPSATDPGRLGESPGEADAHG
jgi:signal peptidase II